MILRNSTVSVQIFFLPRNYINGSKLFQAIVVESLERNIIHTYVNGYKNIGKYFRSKNIKLIVRTQMTKYYLVRLQRSDDCARELQSILKHNVPSDHRASSMNIVLVIK